MHINVLLTFNWGTILSIILFFVALGVLVTIHEFGHFIAAKSFKVYCSDFSIGFGPKIVKIKRKKGETTFSIGVLPLGGYVSMLGEDDDEATPEDIHVPKERTLVGIARYKRIIIMAAGIIMNFLLAYLIFFISASCFPQVIVNSWYSVSENAQVYSLNEQVKFDNNDQLVPKSFYYKNGAYYSKGSQVEVLNILNKGYFTLEGDESETKYIATLSYALTGGVNDTDISKNIILYETSGNFINVYDENNQLVETEYCAPLFSENGVPVQYTQKDGDKFIINASFANSIDSEIQILEPNVSPEYEYEEIGDLSVLKLYPCEIILQSNGTSFLPLNVSFYKYDYWYGWQAFKVAGDDWAQSTTLIGQALINLFIGQGWDQLGGPLAIFSQTTDILQNNPFYTYLNTWGTISVNLALFNLLPFPGLDGWQILVEIVEGSVNGIKKLKYKATKKNIETVPSNDKPIEVMNSSDSGSERVVTANKDANLTIGKEVKKVEGYTEWQIPPKVKTIMSYIGLGLLLVLMIFVLIKDIFMVI